MWKVFYEGLVHRPIPFLKKLQACDGKKVKSMAEVVRKVTKDGSNSPLREPDGPL